MTSPKERRKVRRRAESLMDQAFEALHADHPALAKKLSLRAIDLGFVNPRLWFDHGTIHHADDDLEVAEASYRQAIALAPDYGEAFAALAQVQAARGKLVAAARLAARAVELCPDDVGLAQRLAGYTAMQDDPAPGPPEPPPPPEFTPRTERYDWDAVDAALRRDGMARLPGLLEPDECQAMIDLWDQECFEHEVQEDSAAKGQVTYRFFSRPLPPLVAALRTEVYARLAILANAVQAEVRRSERFPPQLPDFLDRCIRAGQYRTTPILLRYPAGGANAPHRDIAGGVVFPFQLAVTLGPGCAAAGDGGRLRLIDQRPGKRIREKQLDTAVGDGAVFCTRERLVRVGGVLGMQPVLHGVTTCDRERFSLGIPFHEHG